MRYLYADTSIWNLLHDQNADPHSLCLALANRGVSFAIGFNVLYEVAKQFFSGTDEATERGRELFAYINRYLDLRIPILKENSSLLIEEALDVTETERMESCFRNGSQYQKAVQEIEKLRKGVVAPETARFFEGRKSEARASRASIRDHLGTRPDLTAALRGISEGALPAFVQSASVGPPGRFLLMGHLRREFRSNSHDELARVAELLLESPRYRLSHAMTRTDLYLNWRCVNRGSIRSDLPDDTFHVVSAAYCDVFATTEADQVSIARHAMEGIQTMVCNHDERLSDRLLSELERNVETAGSF